MGKKRELSSYLYTTALLIFLLAMYVFNLSNLYDSFFQAMAIFCLKDLDFFPFL